MKKKLCLLILISISFFGFSQETKDIDSTAIFILDKMSDIIGNLESVSFELKNSTDKLNDDQIIEKHYSSNTITFSGPNKLMVITNGAKGKNGFWYDGSFVTYYSFDENNYVTLEAPETTIEMIDDMHQKYDFQFPAADFFYPSFTDDVIEAFDVISYIGTNTIEGEECYHILASNNDLNVHFWVSNKTYLLPKKFVIIYRNNSNLQYESTFSNWSLNPNIPDSVFNFLAPPNANLISILKKS